MGIARVSRCRSISICAVVLGMAGGLLADISPSSAAQQRQGVAEEMTAKPTAGTLQMQVSHETHISQGLTLNR